MTETECIFEMASIRLCASSMMMTWSRRDKFNASLEDRWSSKGYGRVIICTDQHCSFGQAVRSAHLALMSSISWTVDSMRSRKSNSTSSDSLFGRYEHFLSATTPDCCSSMQRSLIAVAFPRFDTRGFMQSCLRDPRVRCLITSSSSACSFLSPSGSFCGEGRLEGMFTLRSS